MDEEGIVLIFRGIPFHDGPAFALVFLKGCHLRCPGALTGVQRFEPELFFHPESAWAARSAYRSALGGNRGCGWQISFNRIDAELWSMFRVCYAEAG